MRRWFTFLILLLFLGILGTRDEALARGRWRQRCQPVFWSWRSSGTAITESPAVTIS